MALTEEDTRNALKWWIDIFDRMPTNAELVSLGASSLAKFVGNSGGFAQWAELLGSRMKPSESLMGKRWERYVADLIRATGRSAVEQDPIKAPFDILVNDSVRVNVKSAHFNTYIMKNGGKCAGYFFGIGSTHKRCDAFALVCDDGSEDPRILWVPAHEMRQQTVTLTKRHRLNDFTEIAIVDEIAKKAA